jgi:catechol 2,3-dioxygenase-like lactoylglutathione lyase family enzyme
VTKVTSFVASTYVRNLDRSRAFYEALGFVEERSGSSPRSAWSYLRHGQHYVLVVTSEPPVDIPALPLHFYFFVDDLGAATAALEMTGATVEHMGAPPHALGGEARTVDPDGNTILVGQARRAGDQPPVPDRLPGEHFSLLREAATLAEHRAAAGRRCEVINASGRCTRAAEVKLADTWGDCTWACLIHAENALINAPAAFIANQESVGLALFLAQQRRADPPPPE